MKSDILIYERALKLSRHTMRVRYNPARYCENKSQGSSLKNSFSKFSFDEFPDSVLFSYGSRLSVLEPQGFSAIQTLRRVDMLSINKKEEPFGRSDMLVRVIYAD